MRLKSVSRLVSHDGGVERRWDGDVADCCSDSMMSRLGGKLFLEEREEGEEPDEDMRQSLG